MDNDKINEILLKLLEDVAVIRAKVDSIEEIKMDAKNINTRVDHLEAQCREHNKTIKSLENRANTMEQFVRNNMQDTKKTQTSIFISMAMAVFSAVVSLIINLF